MHRCVGRAGGWTETTDDGGQTRGTQPRTLVRRRIVGHLRPMLLEFFAAVLPTIYWTPTRRPLPAGGPGAGADGRVGCRNQHRHRHRAGYRVRRDATVD